MSVPLSALRLVGGCKLLTAGAGAPTVAWKCNCTVPAVGTGAGDISITLGQGGVDKAQCVVMDADGGAAGLAMSVSSIVHTSDTVKQFLSFDAAGAAVDATMQKLFFQLDSGALSPGSATQDDLAQLACGVILTTAGAGAPTVIANFGCGIPALGTGTGDISITVPALAENQCIEFKWNEGAAARMSSIVHTSNTAKQILIKDLAGAAADGTVGIFWLIPDELSYQ